MRAMLVSGVVLLLVLASVPAQGAESLVLYDNFNATTKLIDPNKWFGSGTGGTEGIREIKSKGLHLVNRGYGNTSSSTGTHGSSLNVSFPNPASVTAIKATVQVTKFEASGCHTAGSGVTGTRIELGGSYFNTWTPTAGSSLNDVRARIRLERDSNTTDASNVLRAQGTVFQCTVADCSASTSLGFRDLGTVNIGQNTTLRIQWDRDNDRFLFQRDTQAEVFVAYTVSDTGSASNLFQFVAVSQSVANCMPTAPPTPRPVGFMDVSIDDVFVNASTAPLASED